MPGTKCVGLKAVCSTSANKFRHYHSTILQRADAMRPALGCIELIAIHWREESSHLM